MIMAATDKNSKGKRTDYAKHYSLITGGSPVCGNKNYGYSTNDTNEVDCERCTVWLLNMACQINNNMKSIVP